MSRSAPDSESVERQQQSSSRVMGQDRLRAILLIGLAIVSTLLCTTFFVVTAPPGPKSFSFSQTDTVPGTSLSVSGVTGELKAIQWSRSGILVNGTITATGSGASPSQVTLQERVLPGSVSLQPLFPNTNLSPGRTYVVDVNVYFPSALNFSSFSLGTTTGNINVVGVTASTISIQSSTGTINVGNLRSSSLQLTNGDGLTNARNVTTNRLYAMSTGGSVQITLSTVEQGATYSLYSQHGTVNLVVPPASSFKVTAGSLLGHAGYYSGFADCQTSYTQQTLLDSTFNSTFSATCGDGSATISLNSIYGDATITR